MEPLVLLAGCDALELVTNIPRNGSSTLPFDVIRARDALDSRGLLTGSARFDSTGRKRSVGIPWGTLNLQVRPHRPHSILVAWVYLEPQCLHRDFSGAVRGAREALACVYEACRPATAQAAPIIGLRRADAQADFVGFEFRQGGQFRNRSGSNLRIELDEAGRVQEVSTRNRAVFIYRKSTEIRRQPRKAYVRELWEENGYTPDMGDVWRVEVRARGYRRLRKHGLETLDAIWQHGLGMVEMLEEPRPGVPKSMLAAHPVWTLLRSLTFPSWGTEVRVMPKSAVSREAADAQALGKAMSEMARSVALRGLSTESAQECYLGLVRAYFAERPEAERDQSAKIESLRTQYGLRFRGPDDDPPLVGGA